MWAQSWQNIEPLVRPDPDVPGVDVTDEMLRQVGEMLDHKLTGHKANLLTSDFPIVIKA